MMMKDIATAEPTTILLPWSVSGALDGSGGPNGCPRTGFTSEGAILIKAPLTKASFLLKGGCPSNADPAIKSTLWSLIWISGRIEQVEDYQQAVLDGIRKSV